MCRGGKAWWRCWCGGTRRCMTAPCGLRRGCRCIVSRRSSRTFRHDWIRRWSWRRREKREKQQTRCTDRVPGKSKNDSSEKALSSLYFSSLGFFKSKGKRSYWSFGVLMCSWRVKRTTLDVYLLARAAFRRIVCTTKPVRTRWAKAIEPGKRFYIRLRYGMLGVLHCMYMYKNIHMYSTYILLRITRQPTIDRFSAGSFDHCAEQARDPMAQQVSDCCCDIAREL